MHIERKIRIFLIEYYGFLLEPKHCCNVFVYIGYVPRIPLQIWSGLNHFKITLARICTDIKNSIAIKTSKNTKRQMIFCPFVDKKKLNLYAKSTFSCGIEYELGNYEFEIIFNSKRHNFVLF